MERILDNYPTIASNSKIKVKVYVDDGGEQHVHFVKNNGDDLKLSLISLVPLRETSFSRDEVDFCQRWLDENYSYVKRKWSQMRRRHYE
jgi:hypothetical protein